MLFQNSVLSFAGNKLLQSLDQINCRALQDPLPSTFTCTFLQYKKIMLGQTLFILHTYKRGHSGTGICVPGGEHCEPPGCLRTPVPEPPFYMCVGAMQFGRRRNAFGKKPQCILVKAAMHSGKKPQCILVKSDEFENSVLPFIFLLKSC